MKSKICYKLSLLILLAIITVSPFHFSIEDAYAVPTLQLYSDGAVYNDLTQSWMTYNNPFDLQVLGADQPNGLTLIDHVVLDIAVPAEFFNPLGWVKIQGKTSSLEGGPFGAITFPASSFTNIPPIPPDLNGPHGVYQDGAYYVSVPLENLEVDSHSNVIINYVDVANGITSPGTDKGDIDIYTITYDNFFLIHMDLTGWTHEQTCQTQKIGKGKNAHTVTNCTDTIKTEFAPFSHEADAPSLPPVPEPASLLLTGFGFIGLAVASRFISNNR